MHGGSSDINDFNVYIFLEPENDNYKTTIILSEGTIKPQAFPDLEQNHNIPGIFVIRKKFTIGEIIKDLIFIAQVISTKKTNECESIGGNVAEDLFTHGLCLPSGSNLTNEDLNKVIEAIIEAKNCHLLS